MNFSSPSDFKFVTGDLSLIEIDNAIMPTRSGSSRNVIRGIDIAFLMESVEERRRAVGLAEKTWTFSICLSRSQLQEIESAIIEIYATRKFMKSEGDEQFHTTTPFKTEDWTLYNFAYSTSDTTELVIGYDIKASDVMFLYGQLANLNLFAIFTSGSELDILRDMGSSPSNWSTTFDTDGSSSSSTQLQNYFSSNAYNGKYGLLCMREYYNSASYFYYGFGNRTSKIYDQDLSLFFSFSKYIKTRIGNTFDYYRSMTGTASRSIYGHLNATYDIDPRSNTWLSDLVTNNKSSVENQGVNLLKEIPPTGATISKQLYSYIMVIFVAQLRDRTRW